MASHSARFYSYHNTALSIIGSYDFTQPFAQYLKRYFSQHSKFGSRDRRLIGDLCFGYFRLGSSANQLSLTDQMHIGFFLTHQADNGYLELFRSEWLDKIDAFINEKIAFIFDTFPSFDPELIFPFQANLSEGMNRSSLSVSILDRPGFFIRIRPGRRASVIQKLLNAHVHFVEHDDACVEIKEQINLESILKINEDCVVQDISSQKTALLFPEFKNTSIDVWDACAASGGKSIMFNDKYPSARIFASDIRESILSQLRARFSAAGIKAESIFQADLLSPDVDNNIRSNVQGTGFDMILADVPCTGSGTWRRDPEWLRNFNENDLVFYQKRQIQIVENIIPYLKNGGYLLYITCSVFRSENEDVISHLIKECGLKLLESKMISGLETGGDHLFAALLTS